MEHPLIGDISQLTLDELSTKVNDLYKKLAIAQRSGNGHLCNQLRMALETYNTQYQNKLRDSYKKAEGDVNFENKINIQ